MRIEFDPVKDERNIRERGLSFARAAEFDFETAFYAVDNRRDYGETRVRALGYLGYRLHALVYVGVPQGIRVISLRKANQREVARYEFQAQA
ncbi:BrnT family toxin [Immundisolibacter sp.]|uniref:BrnT family toxin n=1 Tax=Immundisolibacter sp. TaxID=1934948 RepID=UPI0035696EAB